MAMSIRAGVQYVIDHVRKKMDLGAYLVADTAVGVTTVQVQSVAPFLAAGGKAMIKSRVISYTGISGDTLTGIPATGAGSVDAIYTAFVNVVAIHEVYSDQEIQDVLDLYRRWADAEELYEDVEKKKYWARRGFFETDYTIRNSDAASGFSTVTADTASSLAGMFQFTTARTEAHLYVAGWQHNPDLAIAHLWEHMARDDRKFNYFNRGQMQYTKKDMFAMAAEYRRQGSAHAFLEGKQ